eukprot:2082115-Amphidinium_carterae.1
MQRVDLDALRTLLEGKTIHKQHSAIGGMPVDGMQGILQFMEPILYTPDALRSVVMPCARLPDQTNLSQLIEYLTGLPPSTNICTYSSMLKLAEHLSALNVQRGRLGQDLPLPPDWETDGIY